MSTELELTDEMIERNDQVYNAVHNMTTTLAERDLEWDMERIEAVTAAVVEALGKFGIRTRQPYVQSNEDGTQEYGEYEDV